jgi:hypothetical protein
MSDPKVNYITSEVGRKSQLYTEQVHRLTEDMIMEFLPPGVKGGVSYGCGHKRPGADSGTTHIIENPATVHKFFNFLSGLEELMQEQS